ncbi:hypothetical protein NE237_012857 [Protea cynaroides]|uniref:Uncharacterized protein n=1 Tax=Protea cynaroides TaxID=273540 RepID=A0A9Q0JXA8_9MAGN|nr:hypothetical protein NE237_012857 [Protea cynaroides]
MAKQESKTGVVENGEALFGSKASLMIRTCHSVQKNHAELTRVEIPPLQLLHLRQPKSLLCNFFIFVSPFSSPLEKGGAYSSRNPSFAPSSSLFPLSLHRWKKSLNLFISKPLQLLHLHFPFLFAAGDEDEEVAELPRAVKF